MCRNHGGAAPQAKAAAARRHAEAQAAERATGLLRREGLTPVTNPVEALTHLVAEVVSFKDVLADRVHSLGEVRYQAGSGGEQLRAEIALYERALDRSARVLADIARLDLDERLVRLNEAQARIITAVLLASAGELGLDLTEPRVVEVVQRQLELVGSGS